MEVGILFMGRTIGKMNIKFVEHRRDETNKNTQLKINKIEIYNMTEREKYLEKTIITLKMFKLPILVVHRRPNDTVEEIKGTKYVY